MCVLAPEALAKLCVWRGGGGKNKICDITVLSVKLMT